MSFELQNKRHLLDYSMEDRLTALEQRLEALTATCNQKWSHNFEVERMNYTLRLISLTMTVSFLSLAFAIYFNLGSRIHGYEYCG